MIRAMNMAAGLLVGFVLFAIPASADEVVSPRHAATERDADGRFEREPRGSAERHRQGDQSAPAQREAMSREPRQSRQEQDEQRRRARPVAEEQPAGAASSVPQEKADQRVGPSDYSGQGERSFSEQERQAIERWYRERNMLPALAAEPARGGLPPGLQRRLDRGGSLPPGWQRKMEPGSTMHSEQLRYTRRVNKDLLGELPPQPEGSVLIEAEEQVVRVLEATGEILDVLGIGRNR